MKWIKAQCRFYFLNGGEEKYDRRERDISARMTAIDEPSGSRVLEDDCRGHARNDPRRISLLDVGSCYNPLGAEDAFDVTAIDLTAAAGGVLRCDFLNVAIGAERILSRDAQQIRQLAANSFDAVVFSLLLEYMPCPRQRYVCCRNAYDVLRSGGLLVIVSPDSKHVGANAKLMRSWRYALSKLGFMRIAYEKLRHVHCLAFRKCARKGVATRWADLQHFSEDDGRYVSETEIFIPQDFQDIRFEGKRESGEDEYDETDLASSFSELPFDDDGAC